MYDPDHGQGHLEDCFWAVVERYEDGFLFCPAKETGMKCEDCIIAWEKLVSHE